jgi:plasmid maintenance system killer protein
LVILFAKKKLQKCCNSMRLAQKTWGTNRGKLVMRRLDEMKDAETLADFRKVHARCHLLTGDREGKWSADVEQPYRLIFEPANKPLPLRQDGGLDPARVTAVRILSIEDTHG